MEQAEIKKKREADDGKLWFEITQNIIPFYLKHGCPCSFPRFRYLTELNFNNFDASPTSAHETLSIIRAYFLGGEGSIYKADEGKSNTTKVVCTRCSSEYSVSFEEFSINLYLYIVSPVKVNATVLGAAVKDPFPLVAGLYSHDSESYQKMAIFRRGSIEEFAAYMKALADV